MVQWILGIDVGTRKTGTAVGQSITGQARPLGRLQVPIAELRSDHFDQIIGAWRIDRVVIGLPQLADGTPHPLDVSVRHLGKALAARYGLPVHYVAETLTSHEALLRFPGCHDKDSAAAAVMVEDFLGEHGTRKMV